ncbi:hypothetical protein JTE90_028864 [Oedothorax gibbosus]|uniref:Short-chain dehydrogenase/reductase 3 n=1 Tax=Oedothorax gibbosus TaxID=931172 RepID=A0AAV6U7V1_9ARAC|nr:hypothetical protein JTE90_028864 [Oedothorax gibbosus]
MGSTIPTKFVTKIQDLFPKEIQVFLAVMSAFHLVFYGYAMDILSFLLPRHFPKAKKDISDQTVLITGAGSGLGRQTAIEFSKFCSKLVLLDLNVPSLLDTKELLDGRTEVFLYKCDVSNREMVYEVAERVKKEAGKVDILVNNAGIVNGQKFLDIPDEILSKTMEVNMLSHFWTILITGAGSGLGRQLAIEFSKHSVCLVLLDLNRSSMFDTEKLLDRSSRTFVYDCDVSDRHKVYEVAKTIEEEVGKVDILVNNAGIVSGSKFLDTPDETILKTVGVNMLAHFWTCKAFLPAMMSSNKGHVVCIASQAGVSGLPRLSDYCASKFGAVGFMESLVLELAAQKLDGVKVTMVCPSLISTGLFEGSKPPLTVLMTPEYVSKEIVTAVLEDQEFLLLPRWSYIIMLLKWTMPRCAVKRFYENSGLLEFMDTFQGREVNANQTEKPITGK